MADSSRLTFNKKIAACIRGLEDLPEALKHPNIEIIFMLSGNLNYLQKLIKRAKEANKLLLVHIDLLKGIGKDQAGLHFLTRRGVNRAVVVVAHSILTIVYHILQRKQPYIELSPTYYEERKRETVIKQSIKKLESLGYKVTVEQVA